MTISVPSSRNLAIGLVLFALSFVAFTHTYRIQSVIYQDDFSIGRCNDHSGGQDFKWVVSSARAIRTGAMPDLPHSPVFFAFHIPFTSFDLGAGYHFYTWLLIFFLFATIYFSLQESTLLATQESLVVAAVLLATLYHTYWFQYELERGNTNTIAVFLCSAGLYSLSRGKIWMSVFLLSLGVQWRMFPVILGALLVLRGGLKPFLIFLAINVAALFVAGKSVALNIGTTMKKFTATVYMFQPNHCLESYMGYIGHLNLRLAVVSVLLAVFFGVALAEMWKNRSVDFSGNKGVTRPFSVVEVGLIGMAFELMSLLPIFGLPYKFVIHICPFLLMISRKDMEKELPCWFSAVIAGGLGVAMAFLSAPNIPICPMKTPAILASFVLYAAASTVASVKNRTPRSVPVHAE